MKEINNCLLMSVPATYRTLTITPSYTAFFCRVGTCSEQIVRSNSAASASITLTASMARSADRTC